MIINKNRNQIRKLNEIKIIKEIKKYILTVLIYCLISQKKKRRMSERKLNFSK